MRKNNHKNLKIVFCGLIVLFVLIILSFLTRQTVKIKKSSFWRIYRANFIVTDGKSPLKVFSFSPDKSFLSLLPGNRVVEVTRGFGKYELGRVYKLGEGEGNKGSALLRETVQENYDLPILGYFEGDGVIFEEKKSLKLQYLFLLYRVLKGEVKTDLKKEDLVVLWFKAFFTGKDNYQFIAYGEDNFISLFKDQRVREESLAIEIFNSTGQDGLAKKASLILENIGGRVIRLADFESKYENCQILVNNRQYRNSYTLNLLKKTFNCWTGTRGKEEKRSDITIILGEDYWKKQSERW